MNDQDYDSETTAVKWKRRHMMLQLLTSTIFFWRSRRHRVLRWFAAASWVREMWAVFGNTKGRPQSFGPVFWYHGPLRKVPGKYSQKYNMTRRVDWRDLYEDAVPFRVGKGLAVRWLGKMYMVGYCRRRPPQHELQDPETSQAVDFWEYEMSE